MTTEDLTDWLETTIDDSFDLGWTSRDAAKLIVSRMNQEGLVLAPVHPAADLVEALEAWRKFELWLFRECNEGTRRHLWAIFSLPIDEIRNHGDERHALRHIRAALSRYAKGGA